MLGLRAILYASKIPPLIITQPSNVTTLTDTTTSFNVSFSGPDLKYKWYISNIEIVTGNILSVGKTYTSIPATSTVYVVASNRFGSVTSNNVLLTVNAPPFNIKPDIVLGGPGLPETTNYNFNDIKGTTKISKTADSVPYKATCYANGGSFPYTFEFYIGTTKITDVTPTIEYDTTSKRWKGTIDLSDIKLRSATVARPRYSAVVNGVKCIVTDKFGRTLTSDLVTYSNYGSPWAISNIAYRSSDRFVSWTNTGSSNTNYIFAMTSYIVLDAAYPGGGTIQTSTDTGYNNLTLGSTPAGSTRILYVTDGISVSNGLTIPL